MDIEERKKVLLFIGKKMNDLLNGEQDDFFPGFNHIYNHNPWFIEKFVKYCIKYWTNNLQKEIINSWLSEYPDFDDKISDKTIAMVFAGNIPLVGLHDFICGIICGIKMKIKPSSKDYFLFKWIYDIVVNEFSFLRNRIFIENSVINNFDAVIATGSDNTNRYFDYYFGKFPSILRKNRNAVAFLSGKESKDELQSLADDIFIYFGLGCRSVSKIFVPKNYNFSLLIEAFDKYTNLLNHHKYSNNYIYQKTILQMNKTPFIDAGNIILIESELLFSPIGILNYSYYNTINDVKNEIKEKHNKIQCVISNNFDFKSIIKFGQSQIPKLNDYADKIDTIKFLTDIK